MADTKSGDSVAASVFGGLFFLYAMLLFWFGSADLFILKSRGGTVFSVTSFQLNGPYFSDNIDTKEDGDMRCISRVTDLKKYTKCSNLLNSELECFSTNDYSNQALRMLSPIDQVMATSKEESSEVGALLCFLSLYVYAIVWFASTDRFLLKSHDSDVLSVKSFDIKVEIVTENIDGGGNGQMICISKDPVLLTNRPLDLKPSEQSTSIYNCFLRDSVLYIASEDEQRNNTSPCYITGNGIAIGEGRSNQEKRQGNHTEICDFIGSRWDLKKRNDSKSGDGNRARPSCIRQSRYVRGRFYTDYYTAEKLKADNLADCIFEVSRGVTIFLFASWCLRVIMYPSLICACVSTKSAPITCSIVYCLYELGTMVVSAILPYMYKNDDIEMTDAYKTMIAGNAIIFIIYFIVTTVLTCACVCDKVSSNKREIQKKKKKGRRLVRIWKSPPMTPAVSQIEIVEEIPLTDQPSSSSADTDEVSSLILGLWNSTRVGIGRDARGLNHTNIEIVDVKKMNTVIPDIYRQRKHSLMDYATRLPDGKIGMDYKETGAVILTMKDLDNHRSLLKGLVNEDINEVLLFHGTRAENVCSIEQNGFDVGKSRSTFVGKGLYFAESPVKADQYTAKSTEGFHTMILARVLLGKTIVLKDNIFMNETNGPPCASCQKINCNKKHRKKRRPFDSVVLDKPGGLFREFVVYENDMAHPEYIITYKRV